MRNRCSGRIRLVLVLALVAAAGAVAQPQTAQASKYAALVMDATSGKVIFSRNADARRFPASLTKVMTLYMTFDALEQGQLSLNQRLKISRRAVGQPPSKIGITTGDRITVEQAIKALVVKSANDVATALAETIAGTEYKFAVRMTNRAQKIGMKSTRFMNASGLPNRNQVTTARDMARMSRALMRDFPQYYHYFNTTTFTWKGRTYRSHNRLLKNYAGTDGIKTGYTRASGFNLTSSVKRDGYHLIGVVMGGRSSASRDAHMREILTSQFKRIRRSPRLAKKYTSTPRFVAIPKPKPTYEDRFGAVALVRPLPKPGAVMAIAQAPVVPETPGQNDDLGDLIATVSAGMVPLPKPGSAFALALASADAEGEEQAGSETEQPKVEKTLAALAESAPVYGQLQAALADGASTSDETTPFPEVASRAYPLASTADKTWQIQVGAFSLMSSAQDKISRALDAAPDQLNRQLAAVLPIDLGNRVVYRARFGPFDEDEADQTCDVLSKRGLNCIRVPGPLKAELASR